MQRDMDKRERIIDAAVEVFCQAGYDAASMADVAVKAGVGKGTLYLYFDSKQSLFEEAYRVCYEARMRECAANTQHVSSVMDKLCMRLRNGTRWEMKSPLMNKLERVYLADPRFGESNRSKALGMRADGVQEMIEHGIAKGELRAMPAPLLEEMYYRLGSAVYYYIEDHPEQEVDEELWARIYESLRGCLGA